VISDWSAYHVALWRRSNFTVWSSKYQGQTALRVIEIKDIDSVVAMVPHTVLQDPRHFLVENPGRSVMAATGHQDNLFEGNPEDDDDDTP
jgi:hypothetical protein